jgi:hypothetical protein
MASQIANQPARVPSTPCEETESKERLNRRTFGVVKGEERGIPTDSWESLTSAEQEELAWLRNMG